MDYHDAGAFARMAQGQKYISDAKQNIRKTDGQIKHWNNTDAIGYGRLGEYKRHNLSTEEIQRSKSSGGSGGKGSVFDIGNIDIFGGESPRQQVKKEFKEKWKLKIF